MRIIMVLLLAVAAAAEDVPVRMAEQARLQLVVADDAETLRDVVVSAGSVGRGEWLEDEAARERLTDLSFAVDWWRWREYSVAFTPGSDGSVELRLSGPWKEASAGREYRQELLWDRMTIGGSAVGFSEPDGWTSPWRPYPEAYDWPLEGRPLGASWHGRPLVRSLPVKAGERVTISLRVRAAVPAGFREPARLGEGTPAHRVAAALKRGVNLGNSWEAPPGTWGIRYDSGDVERIRKAGFDHIRVPVAWHHRIADGRIDPGFLAELEPVLKRALELDMRVLLDWHHFEELVKDPDGRGKEFVEGWRLVAEHFSKWPPELHFELLNEPYGALEGEVLNGLDERAIAAIRESNPQRILFVNPGSWAATDALGSLHLPDGDDRLVVTFHCYDPFRFTHQGASWVGMEEVKGVAFQASDAAAFESRFDDAVAWSRHFGRPVHLGEFGAYGTADLASRKRYARAARLAAERRGIGWCWWEWKAGFGCWDAEEDRPVLIRELTGD